MSYVVCTTLHVFYQSRASNAGPILAVEHRPSKRRPEHTTVAYTNSMDKEVPSLMQRRTSCIGCMHSPSPHSISSRNPSRCSPSRCSPSPSSPIPHNGSLAYPQSPNQLQSTASTSSSRHLPIPSPTQEYHHKFGFLK